MVKEEHATIAGGCFWGVEELMRGLKGVLQTTVGYTGGTLPHPTYRDICTGTTGHAEAVDILFDPYQISYKEILHFFFKIHDPTTLNQQGNDKGSQYRSAIFYHGPEQQEIAQQVIQEVQAMGRFAGVLTTEVVAFEHFWNAEEEHQDYLQKYPTGYNCHYVRRD